MAQLKTCKYCGVSGFLWKRLGADRWALFETDGQGRAVRNHTATCPSRPDTSGAASVAAVIDEQADEIADFIDTATATLDAERERVADAIDAPTILRYEAAVVRDPTEVSEFPVPSIDPHYLIDDAQLRAIKRRLAIAQSTRQPQNIGLHGPAGSGKTTMGVQIGALYQGPTVIIDSTDKETANDWFGTQQLKDGTLTFVESDFVRAVETENCVIILDDVALIQNRTVQSGLNAFLDPSRRSIYVQQLGRTVRVAPGVIFVGTWNVGSEYTSASELSLQIVDRFRSGALFEVPYPDDGILASIVRGRSGCSKGDASRLADVAAWLRSDPDPIDCSTRGLVGAAEAIVAGATIGEALFFSVFGELSLEERQRAYGIIGTNLTRSGYLDNERPRWDTPRTGQYVPVGTLTFDARVYTG
jgi:hypothetical protein